MKNAESLRFQFQTGSIRRLNVESSTYQVDRFQFQTGGKIPELLRQLKHGGGSELKKRVKPAYQ